MGTVDRQGPLLPLLNQHANHQPGVVRKGVRVAAVGVKACKWAAHKGL